MRGNVGEDVVLRSEDPSQWSRDSWADQRRNTEESKHESSNLQATEGTFEITNIKRTRHAALLAVFNKNVSNVKDSRSRLRAKPS